MTQVQMNSVLKRKIQLGRGQNAHAKLRPHAYRNRSLSSRLNSSGQQVAIEESTIVRAVTTEEGVRSVSVEEQRSAAREMIKYFKERAVQKEIESSKTLGWTPKAEIANGRWTMFGLLVGILTEYSTGVNFIDQIKLVLVNMGIVDFD